MQPSTIVAIGASSGGVRALQELVSKLDPSLPATWCVVLHVDAHRSEMPALLSQAGRIPAVHAGNGQRLEESCLYLAPPDLHLFVEDGHTLLSRGPRENWARPAIDPLFRSAAAAYGSCAVGVLLTGNLNDGTAGLLAIKQSSGVTVVQDPSDAEYATMPRSALRHVAVDHCVPLAAMPALLTSLVLGNAAVSPAPKAVGGDHV